jgi:DNA polymerase III subunit gamma/tau
MLGTIDQAAVYEIVTALAALDGRALLAAVEAMSEQAPDYASALAEMLSMLHRIAIAQALPEAVDNSHGDRERIMQLAQQLPSEDVQLFYQTALLGRRDLPLAPDPRAGFEMVLLRMLAFKPQGVIDVPTQSLPHSAPTKPAHLAPAVPHIQQTSVAAPVSEPSTIAVSVPEAASQAAPVVAAIEPITTPSVTPEPQQAAEPVAEHSQAAGQALIPTSPAVNSNYDNAPNPIDYDEPPDVDYEDDYTPASAYYESPVRADDEVTAPKKSEAATHISAVTSSIVEQPVPELVAEVVLPVKASLRKVPYEQAAPQDWLEIYLGLGVTGILQSTVANCQMQGRKGNEFLFVLDDSNSTLYDIGHQQRLADLLSDYFVERVKVQITLGPVSAETPAKMAVRIKQEQQLDAERAIKQDPIVQQLMAQFGATLREDTIQPIN